MDSLNDRMRGYEAVTSHVLTRRVPVIIRVDGRAFHTLTESYDKPFDQDFMIAMNVAAINTAAEMQGFKAAYVASDEAMFALTDYDTLTTEAWFGYKLSKIVSISAALMSVNFNPSKSFKRGVFDSRAFNVPTNDVVNAFLWRAKDWERNSLQMYAQSFYPHAELLGKNKTTLHEMLYAKGKNWATDLSARERNGFFIINNDGKFCYTSDILPSYNEIQTVLGYLFDYKDEPA